MNRFAYRTTGLAIRSVAALSKTSIHIHDQENIPKGALIFVANHFTRLETLFLSYYIYRLIDKKPVWSLAAGELYSAALGSFLEKVGALSTHNPDRDRLMVKSLLTDEAAWIIYPEGRMVKNKKIFDKGRYVISHAGQKETPHTGAAALALRTEFYRRRIKQMHKTYPPEAERLLGLFKIDSPTQVLDLDTYIVPVNLTYYPLRARENLLNYLAEHFVDDMSDRMEEELMTEGTMLFSGVDVDIRFGKPLKVAPVMDHPIIIKDIGDQRPIEFDEVLPSTPMMRTAAKDLMNRYMHAIYHMTTINPEHLFAGILRHLKRKTFELDDLKQRVFLAAAYSPTDSDDIRFHHDLRHPPVNLLVSDQKRWMEHFIHLALEKKVVEKKGNRYVKNQKKLTTLYDFHRVRVENPIKVMVNEIEPVTALQRRFRQIARLPAFWVKRRVVQHLLRLGVDTFDNDYKTYFIENESKPKSVGRPFFLKGRPGKAGILLIHGYMAAPKEVEPLAVFLNKQGWWVYAPRVKGHGTSPEDLGLRSMHDWISSVELGYAILKLTCKKTIVGGFSNGAGLALELASRIRSINGVFAICPPFKLHAATAKLAPAMAMWNRLVGGVQPRMTIKFVENDPENPDINYIRNPISGVRELEQLMEHVSDQASAIDQRILLVLADHDPVVDEKGARRFFDKVGSQDKRYLLLHFKRHGIIRGDNADRVHRVVTEFIKTTMLPSVSR